jgi:hypothetical protein
MPELVQMKARVPRELKKRVLVELAQREMKFAVWLRHQLEHLLQQSSSQQPAQGKHDAEG